MNNVNQRQVNNPLYDLMVIAILVHFLGFPGEFTKIFGNGMASMIDYGCFGLQLLVMILSSGEDYLDLKLFNFQRKYKAIYLFVLLVIVQSLLVCPERKSEAITCARLLVTALFAVWLADNFSPRELLERYLRAQVLFLIFTLVFTVMRRSSAIVNGAFVGMMDSKNVAASELSLGVLVQLMLLRLYLDEDRPIRLFFLVLLLVQILLLVATDCVGGMFVMIVPAVYLLVFEKRWGEEYRLHLGYLYVAATIGFLFAALSILPVFTPLFERMGKDATLTGRVPMWEQLINVMISSHTLLGYGYERFWKTDSALILFHSGFHKNSWFSTMNSGCHNVLMEVWVNLGLVGVAEYFYMVLDALKNSRWLREDSYIFCSGMLIAFTIFGWTERSLAPAANYTLVLFTILGYGCQAERPVQKKEKTYGQPESDADSADRDAAGVRVSVSASTGVQERL